MGGRVCLVIPYYEAADTLDYTLGSVRLRETDCIIMVDDGSRAKPLAEVSPSHVGPTPVRVVTLSENAGIAGALIAGLEAAVATQAEYIARLDCGDLSAPERFERQRDFMDNNPTCALVGSWVEFVKPDGQLLYQVRYPQEPPAIANYMRINSAFSHPAVMFRRVAYDAVGGYSESYPAAEDFDLFWRLSRKFMTANIPQFLVQCRTGDGGISQRARRSQIQSRLRILRREFDWSPIAVWGMVRAAIQLLTPRGATTFVRRRLSHHESPQTLSIRSTR